MSLVDGGDSFMVSGKHSNLRCSHLLALIRNFVTLLSRSDHQLALLMVMALMGFVVIRVFLNLLADCFR